MHFRNGAVAISYVSTLLLILVDEKKVSLDDKLSKWLPEVPARRSGDARPAGPDDVAATVDYVIGNAEFTRRCTPTRSGSGRPRDARFATSQAVALRAGHELELRPHQLRAARLALEKATGEDMPKLLYDKVLRPLGLTNTVSSLTAGDPVAGLHAFTSERREALKIPAAHRFTRNRPTGIRRGRSPTAPSRRPTSTTWRPPRWARFGQAADDRVLPEVGVDRPARQDPRHARLHHLLAHDDGYTYGMGIVISGNWLLQNPLFAGDAG